MKLLAHKIDDVIYYCNESQIAEAGNLEGAAKRMHEKTHPVKKPKLEKVKEKEIEPTAKKPNK